MQGKLPQNQLDAHDEVHSLAAAKSKFLASEAGRHYGYNGWMEQRWCDEIGVRFGPGQHYLDYTGAGQFTTSQLAAAFKELSSTAYGNPHSRNPSSASATQQVAAARAQVLEHFKADADEYYVIFTKGATEGLKMVGEYFPWSKQLSRCSGCGSSSSSAAIGGSSSHFIYTQANHKSVLGIGAYANHSGAQLHCVTKDQMDSWLLNPNAPVPEGPHGPDSQAGSSSSSSCTCRRTYSLESESSEPSQPNTPAVGSSFNLDATEQQLDIAARGTLPAAAAAAAAVDAAACVSSGRTGSPVCHLVAYPAKDNYEGRLYPLDWVKQVHAKSDTFNRYFVLLDCAAFAATHQLDLSTTHPDFVTISFYKLFGYPSGLGVLLVRKEAAKKLRKVYFGGGSVDYCTAEDAWHVLSEAPAGYEDGTLGFLNIASLKHGFNQLSELGGMKAISAHVESLRLWTYSQLQLLQHSNGAPIVKVFGHHEEGPKHQGGIFQFQVLTPAGDRVPGFLVDAAASAAGLHLRTGCNCNPGRCLPNLGILPEEERSRAAESHKGPFLVVMRPHAGIPQAVHLTSKAQQQLHPQGIVRLASQMEAGQEDVICTGHESLVPVPLPLGSVRVSLGAYSTFEDCYALVRLLHGTFRDFEVYNRDVAAGIKVITVVDDAEHIVKIRAKIALASK